jgi:hypothetical protein
MHFWKCRPVNTDTIVRSINYEYGIYDEFKLHFLVAVQYTTFQFKFAPIQYCMVLLDKKA